MSQRAYCGQPHEGVNDAEADRWCEWYHRVRLPLGAPCAIDQPIKSLGVRPGTEQR